MENKNLICISISQEQREIYKDYGLKPKEALTVLNHLLITTLRETESVLETLEELDEVSVADAILEKARELEVDRRRIEARSKHAIDVMVNGSEMKSKT